MGWSTLILGSFSFNRNIDPTLCEQIITEAKEICECEPIATEFLQYTIESLNWSGHVDSEKLDEFFKKYKTLFKTYSLSFWNLEDATQDWYKE